MAIVNAQAIHLVGEITMFSGDISIFPTATHAHVIDGGSDVETRPKNYALAYIMKI